MLEPEEQLRRYQILLEAATRIGSVIGTELGKAVNNLVSKIPFVGGK